VQHIICCDTYPTYAYDFDFENSIGFSRNSDVPPVLQFAFQYTVIILPEESNHASTINNSFLLFALQKTFQAAIRRIETL
jgi:hypothetical protein